MYTKEDLQAHYARVDLFPLNTDNLTPSDIFEMVRKGQPIDSIVHHFPDDDDNDGVNEEDVRKDFDALDAAEAKHVYFDDDLEMLQYMGERVGEHKSEDVSPGHTDDTPPGHTDDTPPGHTDDTPPGHTDDIPPGHIDETS